MLGLLSSGCLSVGPAKTLLNGAPNGPLSGTLDFTLPRWPGGEAFSLSSQRGSVVLVDVWATWCEPCRESLPQYQQLLDELGPKGLKIVTIAVDEDERALSRFIAETALRLPVLRDPNAASSERVFRLKVMPTSVVVDRRGEVRALKEGIVEDIEVLRSELTALLGEPAPVR